MDHIPRWLEAKRTLVKQIRNGETVDKIIDLGESYFHWLQKVSGLSGPLSSMLADTEFVSVDGIDDVLMEKAKEETRRRYAEHIAEKEDLDDKETETVYKSIRGNCCLFEIMVCLAYSINEMFEDTDAYDGCEHFFSIMLKNAGFDRYDEEDWDMRPDDIREYWQKHIRMVLEREYGFYGGGGFFPLESRKDFEVTDRRMISLWQQMNDWIDQHTNEDGEWVD